MMLATLAQELWIRVMDAFKTIREIDHWAVKINQRLKKWLSFQQIDVIERENLTL
jgi:hypothetical protein